MKIDAWTKSIPTGKNQLVCTFQFSEDRQPVWGLIPGKVRAEAARLLSAEGFKPEAGKSWSGHAAGVRLYVQGLGKKEEFTLEKWRQSAARCARMGRELRTKEVFVVFPGHRVLTEGATAIGVAAEAAELALYKFTRYLNEKNSFTPTALHLCSTARPAKAGPILSRSAIVTDAVKFARDLINEPGSVMTPKRLADIALTLRPSVRVTVHDEKWIRRMKMGGIWDVARGGYNPPRFIELRYTPRSRRTAGPLALIGKGITFDSGGLSLKPSKSMETMKCDMSGAAAVLGTFKALGRLKPPVEVRGYIAAAENIPGSNAYKPGDVTVTLSGKTIEVNNTDAEGRVTLADVLAYAARSKPKAMIDLATLTGACVVALGENIAGLFGNDERLNEKFLASARRTGERMWPLPLEEDYKSMLKSEIADLKNAGERYGGAITAALFLKEFVGNTPWVHLDIAGPAFLEKEGPYTPKGGTGFGIRTLLDYLLGV